MSPPRDPTIKLFGKTIPLSSSSSSSFKLAAPACEVSAESVAGDRQIEGFLDDESSREVEQVGDFDEKKQVVEVDDHHGESSNKSFRDGSTSPAIIDLEGSMSENMKNSEQIENTGESKEKTLKKPDKIIPCPRCNSMETKFCYYNNYNVNQPRHFCKKCQRYWTAGGSMRNVPVGSGRRKTKSSGASVCRQMMMNEGMLQANPCGESNGVLRFGPDAPLCDSVANVLNLAENRDNCGLSDEYRNPDKRIHRVGNGKEGVSKPNSNPSVLTDKGNQSQDTMKNFQSYHLRMPCFPGPPWTIPWNPAMPLPNTGNGGYPVAYYSLPSYWSSGMMGSWIHPSSVSPPSTASTHSSFSTSPKSPTLGKHSREGSITNTANSEVKVAPSEPKASRGIWHPKTLRIDDPNEAAKSSIWETLGIQNERSSINEGQMFKSFPLKRSHKGLVRPHPLHSNPAALSRSQTFNENTPLKRTST